MVIILSITCSLGQADDLCVCINQNGNYFYYAGPDAYGYFRNGYYGYLNPPSAGDDEGFGYVADYGTAFFGGRYGGRIFFHYDGVTLSPYSSYTAIGCPLYTDDSAVCNGVYGFADAAACRSCGACCCSAGNTANGLCNVRG